MAVKPEASTKSFYHYNVQVLTVSTGISWTEVIIHLFELACFLVTVVLVFRLFILLRAPGGCSAEKKSAQM